MNGRGQRKSLPEGLRPGQRDFFTELRRVVDTAGLTTRELERRTSTVRIGAIAPVLYSKSQWGRWLNGQAVPPRQAVHRLAALLKAEGVAAALLLALYERTAVPAKRDRGAQDQEEHSAAHERGARPAPLAVPPAALDPSPAADHQ